MENTQNIFLDKFDLMAKKLFFFCTWEKSEKQFTDWFVEQDFLQKEYVILKNVLCVSFPKFVFFVFEESEKFSGMRRDLFLKSS